jgi:excisionase family DNA binding protein
MTPITLPNRRAHVCPTAPQNATVPYITLVDRIASIDHAITVPELSKFLHLGRTAIYYLVKRHAIPHFRIGYNVRFDPSDIAEWLQNKALSGLPRTAIQ